jgi:RNA recognition motif-containing protein
MFPVFVDNIPKEAELTDLRELFCRFGPIIDVTIISSHGFVNFKSSSDAVEAINRLNGFRFLGERLVVEASQELEDFLKSKNERSHRSRSPLGKHVSYEVNLLVSYMYTS